MDSYFNLSFLRCPFIGPLEEIAVGQLCIDDGSTMGCQSLVLRHYSINAIVTLMSVWAISMAADDLFKVNKLQTLRKDPSSEVCDNLVIKQKVFSV